MAKRDFHPAQRKALPAAIAALFALSMSTAHALQTVANCNDAGVGSLRQAVLNAASTGDTVDASGLNGVCSTITLRTGDIKINKTDLVIKGPGSDKLTITGKYTPPTGSSTTEPYRIFTHYGTGTLSIQQVTVSKGYLVNSFGNVRGGCIYSQGNVVLSSTVVTNCTANTDTGTARGGGVYARKFVVMASSTVKYSGANAGTSGSASGGGVYAKGDFGAINSTVSGNSAYGDNGRVVGFGGGVYTRGSQTYLIASSIANNTANQNIGGISIRSTSGSAALNNSTVTGNHAPNGKIGGIYSNIPALYLSNSTIAFNTASSAGSVTAGTGIAIYAYGATPVARLESTLIANNTYGAASTGSDLTVTGVTIIGSNNLIRASGATLPPDTISGECPLLGPWRANGGPTKTLALLGHSPALDAGNNLLGATFDQRGSPFTRMSGPPGTMTPRPDIGAYEVDRSDVIFDVNFEGCP